MTNAGTALHQICYTVGVQSAQHVGMDFQLMINADARPARRKFVGMELHSSRKILALVRTVLTHHHAGMEV